MSVDANPDVARKVRENELNKQLSQSNRLKEIQGVYDNAQGEGSVARIQQGIDRPQEPNAGESVSNSLSNMVNRLKGTIPRLNIVSADVADNVFGKEIANSLYQLEGRDINKVRNDAYLELEDLATQVKPTLGLVDAIENNNWKALAAGTVNAITSLGSTAVPAIATAGAGLFTEMTGDAIVDFNETKAKKLGKSVEQLYKDDQAEFGIPATIGALSGALELYGMKGVKNLITDQIKGLGYKKALMMFAETQKEGLTEFVQTGLEETNRALAEGYDATEASKRGVEKMFSKEGLESYLQGVVGSVGAGGLGQVAKYMTSPDVKTQVAEATVKAETLQQDLVNPSVTPEAKVVIEQELNNTIGNVATLVEEDAKTEAKLNPKQRGELNDVNEQVNVLEATVNDPNVSTTTKESLQVRIDDLNTQAQDIIASKEAPQETESVEVTQEPVSSKEPATEPNTVLEKQPVEEFKNKVDKVAQDKEGEVFKNDGTHWTHLTNRVEAVKDLLSKGKFLGKGEDLSHFTKEVSNKRFNLSRENGSAPYFQQGKFYGDFKQKYLITTKGDEKFTPNIFNANAKDLSESQGIGVLNPENRDLSNLEVWVRNEQDGNYYKIDPKKLTNEATPETTKEVVTEGISQKRNEEVLTKAEDDLKALKQVTNKPVKYQASIKRLNEARKAGEISEQEFNDTKARFDDVIADSTPTVPKAESLTPEETKSLDNELKNEELTTNDFIQYERARAIEDANNATEAIQQPSNDTGGSNQEVSGSETAQGTEQKVKDIQERRQSIKDPISQKLKDQRSQVNSGFDPSLLKDFVELGSTYIEEGVVKASDFIKRFREDYKEMGFDDSTISDEDIVNEVMPKQDKGSESFKKLTHKNIQSDEVSSTLNNVERETGRDLTKEEKEYKVTKRNDALNHGYEVVEKAKEEFGKTYVGDLLNYLSDNASTMSLENRALINISLELDLERQLVEDPDNTTLKKQLKLVRDFSTKFQRSAAIATGYGILRQIARVGYDISQVTDQFFSEQQLEDKRKLEKAIQSTPEDINKEAESEEGTLEDFNVEPKARKPRLGLTEAQKAEKAELAKQFRGVFNDVTRIATLLGDKKFMRYAKLVLLDTAGDFESFAQSMIDSVGQGIKEHLPRIYKEVGGEDTVSNKTENQKEKAKSAKEIVKKALIDKNYGREITVTTKDAEGNKVKEKRQVLDWKKLAGEEGSVDNIKENVEASLKENGYSDSDISSIQTELVNEYNRLHASIIEKSLNELQTRNKEREPIDTKTSAKRLAELYNYGLFESESDAYDNIVNRALGLSEIGQKAFDEAKVLAQSLSDLYRTTDDNGRRISELGLKEAIRNINTKIEDLLSKVAWEQSSMAFKIATVVKEYMGLSQRAMLQTLKQILENPFSGFVQRGFTKLGYSLDGTDSKELSKKRSEAAKIIYDDIDSNGGLNYGEIITPFVSKGMFEKRLDRVSDSKVYHTALSILLGRAYLDAADSMHKSALTERYFVHNLVRILMKKGMPKQEAVEYVSNSLTGQKFSDALGSAKKIIDKANEKAGKKVLPDNPNAIYRLAQNIVKDALVVGKNITLKEVEASYDAAYKAAGFDLGHEANNIISETVSNATSKLENKIKQAVKDKKWNYATALTFTSILTKNVVNPFVSGGTNWLVLSLQKTGVDVVSPLVDYARQKENKLDLTTKDGVKNMENALLSEMRLKNTMNRVVIGAMASTLVAAAAISSGEDEDLAKWLKKNDWARKYFNVLAPQALIFLISMENGELGQYLSGLFGVKYEGMGDASKIKEAFTGLTSSRKKENKKGYKKLGEVLGGHTSFPGPWRVARDIQALYRGKTGQKPLKPDYKKGGFWDGYSRNGLLEYYMLNAED